MITKFDYFKQKLEEERDKLEQGLKKIAKRNPENPEDWRPLPVQMNVVVSDKNELADAFEEMENVFGVEDRLEQRLKEVGQALRRIEKGSYGRCRVCKEEIHEKRLKANPAASACIKHAK